MLHTVSRHGWPWDAQNENFLISPVLLAKLRQPQEEGIWSLTEVSHPMSHWRCALVQLPGEWGSLGARDAAKRPPGGRCGAASLGKEPSGVPAPAQSRPGELSCLQEPPPLDRPHLWVRLMIIVIPRTSLHTSSSRICVNSMRQGPILLLSMHQGIPSRLNVHSSWPRGQTDEGISN